MPKVIDRNRRRLDRWSSALPVMPAALIAWAGDEAMMRTVKQAKGWLSKRQLNVNTAPMRKTMKRELQKRKKLEGVMPFYPILPFLPIAVVTGLATFATVMAVKGLRREEDLACRLDAIEAELAKVKAQDLTKSEPAAVPWS